MGGQGDPAPTIQPIVSLHHITLGQSQILKIKIQKGTSILDLMLSVHFDFISI